eukprot:2661698-Alexandrium_andersonii.AAC.1
MRADCSSCCSSAATAAAALAAAQRRRSPAADVFRLQPLLQLRGCCRACRGQLRPVSYTHLRAHETSAHL